MQARRRMALGLWSSTGPPGSAFTQLLAGGDAASLSFPSCGRHLSYFNLSLRRGVAAEHQQPPPRDTVRQADVRAPVSASSSSSSSSSSSQAESVVAAFESRRAAVTPESVGEYIKALARLDRLDNSRVLALLQVGAGTGGYQNPGYGAAAGPAIAAAAASAPPAPALGMWATAVRQAEAEKAAEAANNAATGLGTAKTPLIMAFADPSFGSQLWRTIRTIGMVFVAVTCVGTLMDDKGGLAKSFLNSPDMKPQFNNATRFADVKGVDEAKGELEEVVEYLKSPQRFTKLGGKLPKGVLLVGPPGTGKTMLARAIAGEAGVPFFYCSGSEFEEVFVGVGAKRVRELFAAAKKHSPCIIFIDEIDAIGGNRNPKDQQYMRMTLNQLLVELDGFKATEGVIVVAATNFPEVLDKALVRPGRFDRLVVVPNPDVKGRQQILESYIKPVPVSEDVDLLTVAKGTPGFSGAELANLINVAALHAAKENANTVNMRCLEFARDRIIMGAERKSMVLSDKSRRLTAYHEGGHALVAHHTEGADPVHKATIVPRGSALGMVVQLPEEDAVSVTKRQMSARLDVCMGGRVAEEMVFGKDDVTTGASSDLQQATTLARAMVTKYGMSDLLGTVTLDYEDGGRSMSSETRLLVEQEVKRLLSTAYERARAVLEEHKDELHLLAKALLDRETLTGDQMRLVLKGEALPDETTSPASRPPPAAPAGTPIALPAAAALQDALAAATATATAAAAASAAAGVAAAAAAKAAAAAAAATASSTAGAATTAVVSTATGGAAVAPASGTPSIKHMSGP